MPFHGLPRDVESGGDYLACLTHLLAVWPPAGIHCRPRGAQFGAEESGDLLQEAPVLITFIRGDVDGDMSPSMSDATFVLKHLYVPGSPIPDCLDSADVTDDGGIEMNDVIYLLKSLYVPGSPPIPEPSSECGEDPTLDELDCAYHPCMDG